MHIAVAQVGALGRNGEARMLLASSMTELLTPVATAACASVATATASMNARE